MRLEKSAEKAASKHLMMGRVKELSQDRTMAPVYGRIQQPLNAPVSTTGAIIHIWKERHFTIDQPQTAALQKAC